MPCWVLYLLPCNPIQRQQNRSRHLRVANISARAVSSPAQMLTGPAITSIPRHRCSIHLSLSPGRTNDVPNRQTGSVILGLHTKAVQTIECSATTVPPLANNIFVPILDGKRWRQKPVSDWLAVLYSPRKRSKLTLCSPIRRAPQATYTARLTNLGCYHTGQRPSHCTASRAISFELTCETWTTLSSRFGAAQTQFPFLIQSGVPRL